MPVAGSTAVVPNRDPPLLPGMCSVHFSLMGVYNPRFTADSNLSMNVARCCGVMLLYALMSSFVKDCFTKGGGLVGKGCVGHVCSPGISLFGTGRSSIGQIGSPVMRSKTNRKPFLFASATTSMLRPSFLIVVNCGAELLSKSQRS